MYAAGTTATCPLRLVRSKVNENGAVALSFELSWDPSLVDPAFLIAEYHSNSRYKPSGAPYRNDYLGIFHIEASLVCHWREYINPQIVAEVLASADGP